MSWFHDFDGGRAFYTAMGHTDETYSEPLFSNHILGWPSLTAMGGDSPCGAGLFKIKAGRKTVLHVCYTWRKNLWTTDGVECVLNDGRILFIERYARCVRLHTTPKLKN